MSRKGHYNQQKKDNKKLYLSNTFQSFKVLDFICIIDYYIGMDTSLVYFLTETVLGTFVLCVCAFASMAAGLWIMIRISDWLDEVSYNHCIGKSSRLARWVVRSAERRVECECQKDLLISICKQKRGE